MSQLTSNILFRAMLAVAAKKNRPEEVSSISLQKKSPASVLRHEADKLGGKLKRVRKILYALASGHQNCTLCEALRSIKCSHDIVLILSYVPGQDFSQYTHLNLSPPMVGLLRNVLNVMADNWNQTLPVQVTETRPTIPQALAQTMARIVKEEVQDGCHTLVPRAGNGEIARALRDKKIALRVLEEDAKFCQVLNDEGFEQWGPEKVKPSNFLKDSKSIIGSEYSAICLVPPLQDVLEDIAYFQKSVGLTHSEGCVVAVMNSTIFNQTVPWGGSKVDGFRDWFDRERDAGRAGFSLLPTHYLGEHAPVFTRLVTYRKKF